MAHPTSKPRGPRIFRPSHLAPDGNFDSTPLWGPLHDRGYVAFCRGLAPPPPHLNSSWFMLLACPCVQETHVPHFSPGCSPHPLALAVVLTAVCAGLPLTSLATAWLSPLLNAHTHSLTRWSPQEGRRRRGVMGGYYSSVHAPDNRAPPTCALCVYIQAAGGRPRGPLLRRATQHPPR